MRTHFSPFSLWFISSGQWNRFGSRRKEHICDSFGKNDSSMLTAKPCNLAHWCKCVGGMALIIVTFTRFKINRDETKNAVRFSSTALSWLSQPNGQLSSKDAIKSVVLSFCCHRYCTHPDWCRCRHRRRHRHCHWWRSIKCTYIARYAPCIPHHSSDSK